MIGSQYKYLWFESHCSKSFYSFCICMLSVLSGNVRKVEESSVMVDKKTHLWHLSLANFLFTTVVLIGNI